MARRRQETDGAAEAPETARRPRRLVQRVSFVIVLMGVGVLVAALISAAMTVRYDAEASVSLPDRLDAAQLVATADLTSFTGDEGQSLDVADEANTIRFIGRSSDAELSARTANAAATAFVDGLGDPEVTLSTPASAPAEPASPRRLLNSLIGLGIGGLIGLVLQAALRPATKDPSVAYVPTWTTIEPDSDFSDDLGDDDDGEWFLSSSETTQTAPISASPTSTSADRPRPRAFQEAAVTPGRPSRATESTELAEPTWASDGEPEDERTELATGDDDAAADAPVDIVIPGAPGPVAEVDVVGEADTDQADDDQDDEAPDEEAPELVDLGDEPDNEDDPEDNDEDKPAFQIEDENLADATPDADDPTDADDDAELADPGDGNPADGNPEPGDGELDQELDVPAPSLTVSRGFRDLVDRTSANMDPLIDRFAAEDDQFVDDLASASDPTPFSFPSDGDELVGQIAFLGDEIATYQQRLDDERARHREERDQLVEDHEVELDALRAEVDRASDEVTRITERRDSVRSQLEDRITELETSLAVATDELARSKRADDALLDRRNAAAADLAAEIEFMRMEVERYQRTLDEERVSQSAAVAAARLENQDELDRIHREHRSTLNQLAQTNRNLLTAQRNEAEAVMAELEADHQRGLDEAHRGYEQRLREAREHHAEQLAKLEERTRSGLVAEQSTELDDLRSRLDAAVADHIGAKQRVAELESEIATSDRRVEQAQLAHNQAERRLREEQRHLERRNEELTELVNRSEQRLADERRRTNEVVRNLLRESASAASAAEWARRSDIETRNEVESEQRAEIERLEAQLRTLEETAARRETTLEATIAELRRRLGASPNG